MSIIPRKPRVSVGEQYHRLTVISAPFLVQGPRQKEQFCHVLCSCGTVKVVRATCLYQGNIKSCGCYNKESYKTHPRNPVIHGCEPKRLYHIWASMIQRCTNQNETCYKNYGGRGISVCDEWAGSFVEFRTWALLNGYTKELTIDRIDNNGNYEPENCRWATRAEQNSNTRRTIFITCFGETKTMKQWSIDSRCAVRYLTLRFRLKSGWEPELALTTPSRF